MLDRQLEENMQGEIKFSEFLNCWKLSLFIQTKLTYLISYNLFTNMAVLTVKKTERGWYMIKSVKQN